MTVTWHQRSSAQACAGLLGLKLFSPAAAAAFPTAPISGDAVLLTSAWVDSAYDGAGLGRLLVQGMVRDLITRREGGAIRAIEAFARTGAPQPGHGPRGPCVLPADFLARVGFKTQRGHPRTPRMRMDMRSVVTWRGEVEAAWERIVGVVRRPGHRPAPVPRELLPRQARSPRT